MTPASAAKHLGWSLALALCACLTSLPLRAQLGPTVADIPVADESIAARVADYLAGREARLLDWLPDGSLLISTRFGDQLQIHRVTAPLGMREQLTWFTSPTAAWAGSTSSSPANPAGPVGEVAAPRTNPLPGAQADPFATPQATLLISPAANPDEPAGFAFTRASTDGQPQLYWYAFKTRSIQMLSSGAGQHGAPVWSKDGQHVAFFGTERGTSLYDIYAADLGADTPPRLLIGGMGQPWQPLDWAPDGRLLLWQPQGGALYLADTTTGIATAATLSPTDPANPGGALRGVRMARFAADGRNLYLISTAAPSTPATPTGRTAARSSANTGGVDNAEFAQLRQFDPMTGQLRDLTNESWDVEDFDVSADGRYLAYTVNANGRSRLTVLDLLRKLELQPAGLPGGRIQHLKFDASGTRLAFNAESPLTPSDIYVYEPRVNLLTRWTHSETGMVDPRRFVDAQAEKFGTWDNDGAGQRQIPAWVYRPRTPGAHPVLIQVHDGPADQARPEFSAFIQFAVNELGYAVVVPNIRGSSGYGQSFEQLDDGARREDALRDLGALLVWIGQQKDLDPGHVVIMGQRLGGFMALAALGRYGDRLRGGIDIAGVLNLPSHIASAPPDQQSALRAELGDEREPRTLAALNRLSPLNNLVEFRRPLLVVQGLNDAAIQVDQSRQLVANLRSRGVDAWYLGLEGEGPSLSQSAREAGWRLAAQFLKQMAK